MSWRHGQPPGGAALSEYRIGASVVARLLELARVRHPFRVAEVMRKDSLELDDADRAIIADTVRTAAERCIVITHGTDTMTLTAQALAAQALAGIADKTIVLVGALAPARFAESDAAFNLGMAFATAQIAAPGVYITMNGSVFPALQVIKDRSKGAFVLTSGCADDGTPA